MGFLELNGLGKRYGSAYVVKDVSLSVEKGHLVCLLGHGGRRGPIGANTNLPRQEDELRALGHRHRVAVEAEWGMHAGRV